MTALFEELPELAKTVPHVPLGSWPSPLEPALVAGRELFLKREDLSAPAYAGNKIRPLEMVFGAARAAGKKEIWATGAYGSNHALAAVVHAPRAGFEGGAILWPQPWSRTAADNLVATASVADHLRFAPSVALMPPIGLFTALTRSAWVMPPGAATPLGAIGHAGAAIELSRQLRALGAGGPRDASATPGTIVLPTGSTCTAVGLLVGTALAGELGLMDRHALPRIVAVRVTPWPITDRHRMARMAVATAERLRRLGAPPIAATQADYLRRLTVTGEQLGHGYGHPTPSGWAAIAEFWHRGIRLDTTYSAKAAAWLARHARDLGPGPVVFWVTKSALPLPPTDTARVRRLTPTAARWLAAR
ncbi:MAG: pyridoxal-phosphate dependent enzyme [Myxococcota bacterium]